MRGMKHYQTPVQISDRVYVVMTNCILLQPWSVYAGNLNSTPWRGNTPLQHLVSLQQQSCYVEKCMLPIFLLYSTSTAVLLFMISCPACTYFIHIKKGTEFYLLSPLDYPSLPHPFVSNKSPSGTADR